MSSPINRREFVKGAATAGALAGLGNLAFLRGLPPLAADEVRVPPNMVRFGADIEPLVRLIEETERERLLETAAVRVRLGTTYQELRAPLFRAGVRTNNPRPVGSQSHTVLVVTPAHRASIAAQDRARWLPLFWGLDNFKASQARHRQQHGNWMLPPVD